MDFHILTKSLPHNLHPTSIRNVDWLPSRTTIAHFEMDLFKEAQYVCSSLYFEQSGDKRANTQSGQ